MDFLQNDRTSKLVEMHQICRYMMSILYLMFHHYLLQFSMLLSVYRIYHFNFNLNPTHESIISVIALPTIGSIVFITASRTIGRFGAASAVTALLLGMNSFANIVPSNQLMPFLPWYLMLIIPAILADLILNKSIIITRSKKTLKDETSVVISGAIIGSIFYILGYPMLPMTFAEPLSYTFHSMNDILINFVRTLPLVFVFTAVPGVAMGITGAIISVNKIKVSRTNIPSNTLSEVKNNELL
jgi:hypothetical protein